MDSNKNQSRNIQNLIKHILLNDWDPIQVKDVAEAADEYDSYIGEIFRLLLERASVDKVAAHLLSIEREQMGLDGVTLSKLRPIAQKLCNLDISFGKM